MPEKGDSLTRIRGRDCHGCYCFLYDVSSFYETPGDQPGGGKAYSIEKGTYTLYIKSKTDMIRDSLGGIMPRVSNHESVAVRLKRITEGNLPRC